jgi:ATP-dependent DNA helicase RecQ
LTIQQILLKYWGYPSFRPLQEEIIQSVMDGKDTLALMPTGGGKSITFQVPALARDGLCLVISPLIALMKDQVDNLKKRGIKAAAVYSGMHPDEINIILNNARHGEYKLLYVSPERLASDKMRDAVRRIKISLLAVDEAHCISQWGYDFRPPYLQIAEIRDYLPGVPVLALTATATPVVAGDIQQKLRFPAHHVLKKSFERKNLTYYVFREEDKFRRMEKILSTVNGCGIIYVRNRKHTREIAIHLEKKGFSATYYHAGLEPAERVKRQNEWVSGKKQVMVSTNAFGMGIDKSNVRFVIHADLPDSLEAYFQEAGRAGRDEKRSFAVLLFENSDILNAKHNLETAYPELPKIKDIYQALGNYFRIPVGSGQDLTFDFDLGDFSDQYKFNPTVVINSLKFLEKEGYIFTNEALNQPSAIHVKTDKENLYRFQVENAGFDAFLKVILRSYSGVFSGFAQVSEPEIARRSNLPQDKVVEMLTRLEKMGVIDYQKQSDLPRITFTEARVEARHLTISPENYRNRQKDAEKRLDAVLAYIENNHRCRSMTLLAYFGESDAKRCGKCDVCIERNKIDLSDLEFESVLDILKPVLRSRPCSLQELIALAAGIPEDKTIRVIRWLADYGKIEPDDEGMYKWK